MTMNIRDLISRKYVQALFFFIILLCCCTGCVKWRGAIGIDADLAVEMNTAVSVLLARTQNPLDPSLPLLVTTIVNIDALEDSSTFGRTLSQYLCSALVIRGNSVKEVRMRTSLFVKQKGGEFILSRDVKKLISEQSSQAILVGTYSMGRYTVQVNLRLIDSVDSTILSSYDVALPLGCETRALTSTY